MGTWESDTATYGGPLLENGNPLRGQVDYAGWFLRLLGWDIGLTAFAKEDYIIFAFLFVLYLSLMAFAIYPGRIEPMNRFDPLIR